MNEYPIIPVSGTLYYEAGLILCVFRPLGLAGPYEYPVEDERRLRGVLGGDRCEE